MKVLFLRRWREVRLQLIPDWKQAWRFASVQAAALLAVLSMLQSDLLPFLQPLVAPQHWPYVSAGLAALIAICRILQQNLPAPKEPQQ